MSTTARAIWRGVAAAALGLAMAVGAASAQQPLVIDAATGQPIRIDGLSSGAMTTLQQGGSVMANTPGGTVRLQGEIYRPGIWTDPDGCQHWVMDDGAEGYMAPILARNGMPVCGGGAVQPREQFVIRKYDVPYTPKYSGSRSRSGYGGKGSY